MYDCIGGDCICIYIYILYIYCTYSSSTRFMVFMLIPNTVEGGHQVSDQNVPKIIKIPHRLAKVLEMQFEIVPHKTKLLMWLGSKKKG